MKKEDVFCRKCGNKIDIEKNLITIYEKANYDTLHLISFIPFIISGLEGEEEVIASAIAEHKSTHFKIFIYCGYFIRKYEKQILKKEINKSVITPEIQNLVKTKYEKADKLMSVANVLDNSNIIGFGPNILPFLFLDPNHINTVFDELWRDLTQQKLMKDLLHSSECSLEELEEILSRGMFFGYCLGVAHEIIQQLE